MGCSPGNPLTGACAVCCDGSPGCGCETALACQAGLSCVEIFDVPGILTTAACSECSVDADCAAGQLCSPMYDLNGFRGQFACIAPGTKAIGEGCDDFGSGDAQCASGQCAPAAVMGIPLIEVCSECDEDADCGGGSCVLPEIALNGDLLEVVPGACV
jgi:Cys-rich repeat protein